MRKVFLAALLFAFLAYPAQAQSRTLNDDDGIKTVTGTIERVGKNSIDIADESNRKVMRLIYIPGRKEFKAGERVRAQYNIVSRVVVLIKHMMPVERKEGQNAGYLLKK